MLDRHGVDYVLVGGAAAAMLGAERLTQDVDCVVSRELTNLERVAAALRELDARLRVAGMSDEEARALNVQLDVHSLQGMRNSTWTTDVGQFDILSDLKNETGGPVPYEVLVTRSSAVAVNGYQVRVVAVTGFDTFDLVTQGCNSHHYTRSPDGAIRYGVGHFRYIWPAECDLMAQLAGMELESRVEDWNGKPFTSESEKHASV